MRSEGRDLERERLAGRGGTLNEGNALLGHYVGEIVGWGAPVVDDVPVLVQVVIEPGVAVVSHVPFAPPGRDRPCRRAGSRSRRVAVEVLAHHSGHVAA